MIKLYQKCTENAMYFSCILDLFFILFWRLLSAILLVFYTLDKVYIYEYSLIVILFPYIKSDSSIPIFLNKFCIPLLQFISIGRMISIGREDDIMNIVTYPVLFEKIEDTYLVTVPDIGQMTQGTDPTDAIAMARDLISLWVMNLEDSKKAVPMPDSITFEVPEGAFVSYVDANITEYRNNMATK